MAQADTKELYPLSTAQGEAIPYDVFRPYGAILVAVDDAVSGSIVIPTDAELLVIECNIACIIRFDAVAEVPADGEHLTDAFILPADIVYVLDHNAAAALTVIGITSGETGTLLINTVKKWKAMFKPTLTTRG